MTEPILMLSKAPEDPEEKKEWVKHMVRIQVAMWVDEGARCAYCRSPYFNVDNFLVRNPERGANEDQFVDQACWSSYEKVFEGETGMRKKGHRQRPKEYDRKSYSEDMRKFSKMMLGKSKGTKDEQYYLGRMHSAKMIRDWIPREKVLEKKPE